MSSPAPIEPDRTTTAASSRVSRRWSDLSYDLLLSIFSRLSGVDLIVGVCTVCSPWRAAARHPQFWRILDLSDWDSIAARIRDSVTFDEFFRHVIAFVSDTELIERVCLPSVANGQDLILVASSLPELSYLSFPNPHANQAEVCIALRKFSYLQGLTINVSLISTDTLSCLEKFPAFSELKLLSEEESSLKIIIVAHMYMCLQRLRKLEMPNVIIPTIAFVWLIEGLEKLEYLDISGNDLLGVEKEVMEKTKRLKVFIC
ncbi:hypothetical protein LUZ60_001424 [Juncus effusus]|nr:hypothetical protein LUZ60_001424 [Juncus effusus]